ncbi:MAG: L,D-transpeptidase family protein [Candidatus Omnitrophota bacterium]|nr:L,D-transpeptidase family protein [Candidatus Omnitrophota bacterium]
MKKLILIMLGVMLIIGLITAVRFIKPKKIIEQNQVKVISAANDELIYKQAWELANKGDQDKAAAYWKRLADEFPQSSYAGEALFNIGENYLKKGELLSAEEAYKKIIQDYPNSKIIKKAQQSLAGVKISILFSPIKTTDSQIYEIKPGDTLDAIARKFNITVELIKKSNQLTSDFIRQGQRLKISNAKFSLIIDKSLHALTLKSSEDVIKVYTISTGRPLNPTPVGEFSIVTKLINPVWRTLPPNDPRNILGSRWMGFEEPYKEYGIHGTIDPGSMGKDVTKGCVRMLNQDIEELYAIVPLGTKVTIIE